MRQYDLSQLIEALARSVDDGVASAKRAGARCTLEEFECTVTLNAEIDTASLKTSTASSRAKGLKVFEARKPFVSAQDAKKLSDLGPVHGSITVRAIFTPESTDDAT